MIEIKSCGFIVFRRRPQREFLLMQHRDRWDLPKGHLDPGESDMDCALRELNEETGIEPTALQIDPAFCFETTYRVRRHEFPDGFAPKQLRIFLGEIEGPGEIRLSEHIGYRWFPWNPPHRIQPATIDSLLQSIERHWAGR